LAAAIKASPIPVLPLVGSISTLWQQLTWEAKY